MSSKKTTGVTRRDMIKTSSLAAAGALAGVPLVHAGENNLIQVALVGCGGRGTGAAENALQSSGGPTRLVAMADAFQTRLNTSHGILQRALGRQVDVPEARRFVGLSAYRQAMDSLRAGDVVILATPPAFRWPMFAYAIEKRLNVFMEKPISVDGPSTRRMFALGEQATRAGLKVGVGLMCRHCDARKELYQRIRDGQIGDITLMRAYRMHGPIGFFNSPPKPDNMSHLMYQIQRFHSFLWASGGCFSDFYIHNIDECCWMKDAWPVQAQASGGRHYRRIEAGNYRGDSVDQNFDSYSVEYTFGDGTKLLLEGRCIAGCHNQFASYAHGTRAAATISRSGHSPAHCRIFRNQIITNNNADAAWRFAREEPNPYQLEWNHLMAAIRNNRAYNEVARGAEASLITAMGRYAAHTGQIITRDQMLNHQQEFAPTVDRLTAESDAPLMPVDGKYPVPQPGIVTNREY